MGLHKPFDRPLFLLNGSVMTEGGSLDLSRGQIGIFDLQSVGENGLMAVKSFLGFPEDRLFEFRYRQDDRKRNVVGLRNTNDADFSSHPFSLKDIVSIKVDTPKVLEATPDEVIVGYNGIDDDTAITFKVGQSKNATIVLSGAGIGMLGYPNATVQVPMFFDGGSLYSDKCEDKDSCGTQDCKEIVKNAIEVTKQFKLRGGVPVTEFVEITPIFSCVEDEETEKYKFWTLEVCDTGDTFALATVRQFYPGLDIERIARNGAKSVYQLLQPSADPAPEKFCVDSPGYIKGCKACVEGYNEIKGGLVYSFTIDDDGSNMSSVIENIEGVVAGSVEKAVGQEHGIGLYTALFSKEISAEAFKLATEADKTIRITFVGEAQGMCVSDAEEKFEWKPGNELELTKREFTIDLPDNICDGSDRLEELQKAYPKLDVKLEGTKGGCQTRYSACVKTNLRGEECDPIFLDMFTAKAPVPYEGVQWKPVVKETNNKECKCGFKVKGKIVSVIPTDCVDDEIAFIEDPIKVSVAGGWIGDVVEGFGPVEDSPFATTYRSRATKRDKLGHNLKGYEKQGIGYFNGGIAGHRNNVEKFFRGSVSNVVGDAQYVDYAITIRRNQFSQGMGKDYDSFNTFHIMVEVGRHEDVEDLLNNLAAQAGVSGVKAFA